MQAHPEPAKRGFFIERGKSRMPMIEGRPFAIYGRLLPSTTAADIHLTATFREDL